MELQSEGEKEEAEDCENEKDVEEEKDDDDDEEKGFFLLNTMLRLRVEGEF